MKSVLELRNAIPSHDTLGRVIALLDPAQLQDEFLRWISTLAELDGEFLAVDGKTLRRAYETGKRKRAGCDNRYLEKALALPAL